MSRLELNFAVDYYERSKRFHIPDYDTEVSVDEIMKKCKSFKCLLQTFNPGEINEYRIKLY